MFWRFDRALPEITISVRPCFLRTSRHHRLHLSCGSPLTKNLSLWCWDLRSCHLNCQSLWMCLIGRGGLPSTGGWDTNTKSHASTRSKSDTHRGHHINVCMTHWIIRVEAWAQANTGGNSEMSRQDEPSREELASGRVNQNEEKVPKALFTWLQLITGNLLPSPSQISKDLVRGPNKCNGDGVVFQTLGF